jgi:hypothetical protein
MVPLNVPMFQKRGVKIICLVRGMGHAHAWRFHVVEPMDKYHTSVVRVVIVLKLPIQATVTVTPEWVLVCQ